MPSNRDYKAPGVFAEDASTTIPTVPITGASYRDPDSDQNIGNGWPFGQLVNSARFNQIMYKLTRLIKGIDEQGILSWSSATDYGVDAVVIGSDGQEYVSILASGPSGAGAQDPVSASTYWRTKSATQAETDAGANDRFFVTPNKLNNWAKQATESVLGLIRVATQAQTNAGTNDAVSVTPKKLRSGFSISLNTNGYVVLPTWMSGIIIQWGRVNVDYDQTNTPVTFPISFTNACLNVQVTPAPSSPVTGAVVANANALSQSGFNILGEYSDIAVFNIPTYWFAIGY